MMEISSELRYTCLMYLDMNRDLPRVSTLPVQLASACEKHKARQ